MRGYFLGGSSETFQRQRAFQRACSAWSCTGNREHHCGEVFCEGPRTGWCVSFYFLHSLHDVLQVFHVLLSKQHAGACVVQHSTWFFSIWSSLLCGCVRRITAVMQNLRNRAAFLAVQCWSELQALCSNLTYFSIHTVHIALFSNLLPVFLSSFFPVKVLLQASNSDN